MQITSQSLEAIKYSINTIYQQAFLEAQAWWMKVAMKVPSTGKEVRYGWMKQIPKMREWIGERMVHSLESADYAIKNKKFELTIGIKRDDIEDDSIGLYSPTLQMMGGQAKKHPDDLITDLFRLGQSMLCFDGQAFFSASHPTQKGASTYQNYWSTGMALNAANYGIVRAAMRTILGDDGRPLGVNPNLLVVPPQLETTAFNIINAQFIAPTVATSGNAAGVMQENPFKGTANILVIDELGVDPTAWYLLDTSRPIKPFVFQERRPPTTLAQTDLTSDNVFNLGEYRYGVDSRDNAGFGLPFLAAKAVA